MSDQTKKPLSDAAVAKLRKAYAFLGSANRNERDNAFGVIQMVLKRHDRTWADLLELIGLPSAVATNIPPADRQILRGQHELLGGSVEERETARTAILNILKRSRCTWNDLIGIISDVDLDSTPTPLVLLPVPEAPDPLDCLVGFLPQFIDVTDDEVIAIALWILHSFFFEDFENTPRLVVTSPVPGCGKTAVLQCVALLGEQPLRTDGITPAAIVHLVDNQKRAILIDEADNNAWATDFHLRRVLNSGHLRTGTTTKLVAGEPRVFSTFSPVALATLEHLPLPLIRRSIIIRMKMTQRRLERISIFRDDFDVVRRHLLDWAQGRKLNLDPELPAALHNRVGDNWRPLLSIADACGVSPGGKPWGVVARDVAVRMSARYSDADLRLILLGDIKVIFDGRAVDRIAMNDLVEALIGMEGTPWIEYRGLDDDKIPRKLTAPLLSNLLRPFGIRARSHRIRQGDNLGHMHGFIRRQFLEAWSAYLREDDHTTAQVNSLKNVAAG